MKINQSMGLATVLICVIGSNASAFYPVFYNTSPELTYVRLDLGQTSFEVTGYAVDNTLGHTVSFEALKPNFMNLYSEPGNPGFFRLYAENLTGAHYGGYFVTVIATDDGLTPYSTTTSFAIAIVPEPATLGLLGWSVLSLRRRRN